MNPFNVVDMQVARNPVARAIANKNLKDAVRSFQTRLYMLADGEDCEADCIAAMQVFAVLMECLSMTGQFDSPDGRVIRGAMSCLVQIANRGFKWKAVDAVSIDSALDRSVALYAKQKAVTVNKAWKIVMRKSREIEAEAA